MKRFSFDLEKVLTLRAYREREAEIELGRAIGALSLIENRIKDLAKERLRATSDRFAPGRSAAEMRSYDLYVLRLDKTRDTLFEAAAKAQLKVAAARELYIEASRERKILDKLKERRMREFRKSAATEEVKVLDDISTGAPARRLISGGF